MSGTGSFRPNTSAIQRIATLVFGDRIPIGVERAGDGISTLVYRLHRGKETFYLRVLPDVGDTFAPEAHVHSLLRERGVHVPEVAYLEDCNQGLQRSVMITTEVRGQHVGHLPLDDVTRNVLIESGRELAIINSVPVEGFGWIKRGKSQVRQLEAEQPSNRAFLLEDLDRYLSVLSKSVLPAAHVTAIRDLIRHHMAWIDVKQAWLAHGDFDLTHIYQESDRYTGIIDFGEIRGTDHYYDLGHFRLHDGETAPYEALSYLLAGYQQVQPLPPDYEHRIAFLSLLIGVRFLARGLEGLTAHELSERTLAHLRASIERDLELLCGAV